MLKMLLKEALLFLYMADIFNKFRHLSKITPKKLVV